MTGYPCIMIRGDQILWWRDDGEVYEATMPADGLVIPPGAIPVQDQSGRNVEFHRLSSSHRPVTAGRS